MTATKNFTLLDAVTSTGAGSSFDCESFMDGLDIFIDASSVTTGATVNVQVQAPNGDWHDLLDSTQEAITANGNFGPYHSPVGWKNIRGNVSALTDGTYTVSVIIRKEA